MSRKFIILGLSLLLSLCAAAATESEELVSPYLNPQEENLPNSESEDFSLNTHLRSGFRNRRIARQPFGTLFSSLAGKMAPFAAVMQDGQISLYSPIVRQNLYEEFRVYRI